MSYKSTVIPLLAMVAGMLMLVAATPTLYRIFCEVTGFGGTTQRASSNETKMGTRIITVKFNADTDPKLPWKFTALQKSVAVKVGENKLIAFHAVNESAQATLGTATYNVTPFAAGKYFTKIQCFCFEQQHLAPHQSVNMPVSFFIDPAILDDPEARDVANITLSYTFFSYDSANQSKLRASP